MSPGAALDQSPRGVPLAEGHRVVERRPVADHRAPRIEVGAGVEERVERFDVVGARRPVQRRLGMLASR